MKFGLIVYETDNEIYINKLEEIYNKDKNERISLLKIKKYGRVYIAFLG